MHVLRGMRRQVAVRAVIRTGGIPALAVNGAAPDRQVVAPERHQSGVQPRRTIARDRRLWRDDHELGALQPAGIEIVEVRVDRGRRCGRASRPHGAMPRYSRRPFGGKTAPHAVF